MSRARVASLALVVGLGACGEAAAPRSRLGDLRDHVIYHLLTDRFANGDPSNDGASGVEPVPGDFSRIQGGDWRGIEERLDYVEELGATAIWISPIVRTLADTSSPSSPSPRVAARTNFPFS